MNEISFFLNGKYKNQNQSILTAQIMQQKL